LIHNFKFLIELPGPLLTLSKSSHFLLGPIGLFLKLLYIIDGRCLGSLNDLKLRHIEEPALFGGPAALEGATRRHLITSKGNAGVPEQIVMM